MPTTILARKKIFQNGAAQSMDVNIVVAYQQRHSSTHLINWIPLSSEEARLNTGGGGTRLKPFVLRGESSFEVITLNGTTLASWETHCCCCCKISMRFEAGTSPLQYLHQILRYTSSKPRVKFAPSHTGDSAMRSRKVILKFESSLISEANLIARFTYSSSVFATRLPNPASK